MPAGISRKGQQEADHSHMAASKGYGKQKFEYDEENDGYICPQGSPAAIKKAVQGKAVVGVVRFDNHPGLDFKSGDELFLSS